MSNLTVNFPDLSRPAHYGRTRYVSLAAIAALLCLLPGVAFVPDAWTNALIVAGVTLLITSLFVFIRGRFQRKTADHVTLLLNGMVQHDRAACFIADGNGRIITSNQVAVARFHPTPDAQLEQCLRTVFANPAAVLLRLQSQAKTLGHVREVIATRSAEIVVDVSWLQDNLVSWRFELDQNRPWATVESPVLRIGRNNAILDGNKAAHEFFGDLPASLDQVLAGKPLGKAGPQRCVRQGGSCWVVVTPLRRSGVERDMMLVELPDQPASTSKTSFASLPVPLLRLSLDGIILDANHLARRLIGEVRVGTENIAEIMQSFAQPVGEWLNASSQPDEAPRSEFLRLRRDDKEIFVQVTLSRIEREGQTQLIAVLNDATELKTLEAQFVQGQKMQAVGQLAGGVAHDFNNLLTAISGHCDLLLLRHDQSDPNYGDLVQINQNANRAAALVSQLLAFSRKQTLRPEVLDLRDTISDLIHLLNRLVGEKVQLTLSHDPVVKPVRADKRQLEQVLMNLVVNARDAMPDGGEIRIETEVLTLDKPITRDRATVQKGQYVTVKVIDSGTGIPADKLQKIFEPFYTTKRTGEGTGLGLSTVYGIVKQTGGFIFVDSTVGRGSEFTVYLPVCHHQETPVPEEPATPEHHMSSQGEGVVLLVEDEAPVRAFATRALRLKGYTVLEADSAESALNLLQDAALHVDVFVTDVVMPGMDGPTWVRKAMETRPDVRVVFMSGYTEGAFDETAPQIAQSTFLPKPFSLTQLTEAVFQQFT